MVDLETLGTTADALTQAQTLCAIHHTLFIQPHVGKTTKAKV
jgi:hypothetical protein